jgi:ribosomal protein S21
MPNIMKRAKSVNIRKQNNKINGFDKAINRIKAGTEKNQLSKEMREYKPIG